MPAQEVRETPSPCFRALLFTLPERRALNAQESNKVSGNPTFLRTGNTTENQTASTTPALRLKIQGNGFLDETVLYYQSEALRPSMPHMMHLSYPRLTPEFLR